LTKVRLLLHACKHILLLLRGRSEAIVGWLLWGSRVESGLPLVGTALRSVPIHLHTELAALVVALLLLLHG